MELTDALRPATLAYTPEGLRRLVFMTLFPQATAWAVLMAYASWQWPPEYFERYGKCLPPIAALLVSAGTLEHSGWIALGGVLTGQALASFGSPTRYRAWAIQALGFLFSFAILAWSGAVTGLEMCWTDDPLFPGLGWYAIEAILVLTGCRLLYRGFFPEGGWLPMNEFLQLCLLLTVLELDTHHT